VRPGGQSKTTSSTRVVGVEQLTPEDCYVCDAYSSRRYDNVDEELTNPESIMSDGINLCRTVLKGKT